MRPKSGQTRRSAPTEIPSLAHWTGNSYQDPPKTFDVAENDERLVTLYKAGHPQEYATSVEKVGEQIWKKVLEDGAYIDVIEGRGIIIPADKILEIEVRGG